MSINAKITAAVVIYIFLFSSSIFLLAGPASASDYVSNYVRIPAVQTSPPKVGAGPTTPPVIVCEYAPVRMIQIKSATAFWE